MRVYKFSDYLKSGGGNPLPDSAVVCEIETINVFPQGLCELDGKMVHVCMIGIDYVCIEYIKDMPKVSKLSAKHEITCPHCGSESSDSWDYGDSDDNYDCGVCGSVFSYQREVDVSYSSTIVKRNNDILIIK